MAQNVSACARGKIRIEFLTPFRETGYPYQIHGKNVDAIAFAAQRSREQSFPLVGAEFGEGKINRHYFDVAAMDGIKTRNDFLMRRRNIIREKNLYWRTLFLMICRAHKRGRGAAHQDSKEPETKNTKPAIKDMPLHSLSETCTAINQATSLCPTGEQQQCRGSSLFVNKNVESCRSASQVKLSAAEISFPMLPAHIARGLARKILAGAQSALMKFENQNR